MAGEEEGAAAICAPIAARQYGLPILYQNIQDSADNQTRFLIGYESEIVRNLTANFQIYSEYTHHYSKLKEKIPSPDDRPRKARQVITTRWTLNTQQSNIVYSAFLFYSPSDDDYYLIPNIMVRIGDSWQINGGANVLGGSKEHTLFGQIEQNSNIYARAKFIF